MSTSLGSGPLRRDVSEWVIFGCAGKRFALPLTEVREILPPQPYTRLPGCGPEVCGLTGIRGRIWTVVDIGAALSLRPAAALADHRLLLFDHAGWEVAGVVDEVYAISGEHEASTIDLEDLLGRLLA